MLLAHPCIKSQCCRHCTLPVWVTFCKIKPFFRLFVYLQTIWLSLDFVVVCTDCPPQECEVIALQGTLSKEIVKSIMGWCSGSGCCNWTQIIPICRHSRGFFVHTFSVFVMGVPKPKGCNICGGTHAHLFKMQIAAHVCVRLRNRAEW